MTKKGIFELSIVKQGSSGASPVKRPGKQTLAQISKENIAKFEKSLHQRSVKKSIQMCPHLKDQIENIRSDNKAQLPVDYKDIYPRFVHSQLEKNNLVTAEFFKGSYINTNNLNKLKELLQKKNPNSDQTAAALPTLVEVEPSEFYKNHLVENGIPESHELKTQQNEKYR